MNVLMIAIPFAILASAAVFVPAHQEKEKAKPPDAKPQDAKPHDASGAPPMPKPGPEHQPLKLLEGTWNCDVEHTPAPGAPAMKSKGVETNKLICNGLWLASDVKGEMGSETFEGHGTIGYDTIARKYRSTWVDNCSTNLTLSEGTYDEKTKTFTMTGEGPDMTAKTPGKTAKFRMVDQIKGNERTLTHYQTGPDGKEWVCMTIQYKKK